MSPKCSRHTFACKVQAELRINRATDNSSFCDSHISMFLLLMRCDVMRLTRDVGANKRRGPSFPYQINAQNKSRD